MDWQGQKLAKKLMEIFLVAFAVVAFVVGYAIGSFQTMLLTYATGMLLTAMVTVPNWPLFNHHPLNWLDPSEVERHPKPQPAASHSSKKKTSKKIKPESPRARSRPLFEMKEGTPTRKENCNCKHSRCLKLYCECFASGVYCDGCNCANCCNNVENEATRHEAVEATLERNPNAFRPKIGNSRHSARGTREDACETTLVIKHNKGCHCKKSGCVNKYCECFQANILCSDYCKCIDCKNFDGSDERKAIHYGDPGNALVYMQQTAKLH